MNEKVIGILEEAGNVRALAIVAIREATGYGPLLTIWLGISNLSSEERAKLSDEMITLAQQIRYME